MVVVVPLLPMVDLSLFTFGRSNGEMNVGKLYPVEDREEDKEDGSLITSAARRERS